MKDVHRDEYVHLCMWTHIIILRHALTLLSWALAVEECVPGSLLSTLVSKQFYPDNYGGVVVRATWYVVRWDMSTLLLIMPQNQAMGPYQLHPMAHLEPPSHVAC